MLTAKPIKGPNIMFFNIIVIDVKYTTTTFVCENANNLVHFHHVFEYDSFRY